MNTRRDFIMSGIAASLPLIGKASPVKTMLGGYGSDNFSSEPEKNPNPYITAGLVAMWDGEWNIGFGEHDPESAVWVDLTGNGHDWSLTSNYSWGDTYLAITGKCGTGNWIIPYQYSTTETVVSVSATGSCILMEAYSVSNRPRQSIAMNKKSGRVGINNYWHKGAVWADLSNVHSYSINDSDAFQDGISQPSTNWDYFGTGSTTISQLGGEYVNTVYNFKGNCYCMRVYDRYLSNDEILFNYGIDRERFTLP